jgi:hypothetical protein
MGSKRRSTRLRRERSAVDAVERTEQMNGNERIYDASERRIAGETHE